MKEHTTNHILKKPNIGKEHRDKDLVGRIQADGCKYLWISKMTKKYLKKDNSAYQNSNVRVKTTDYSIW